MNWLVSAEKFYLSRENYYKEILFILELMSGVLLDDVTSQLCRNCIARIESFDDHYTTAMRIKDELCEVIKVANAFVHIKVEPDIKEELAVSYTDYAPNDESTHLDNDFVDNSFFNNDQKPDPNSSDESLADLDYGDEIKVKIKVKKKSGRPKKTKPEFYDCPKCGKAFNHKYMLTKHLQVHETVRKYSCMTCGKGFKCSSNFKQHQKIHAKHRTKFLCDLCGSHFLSKVTLRHHLVSMHTDIRNFLCSHCPKAFGSMSTLRVHAITHIEFKKECCDQCGARFHNKDKLRRHVRGMHSEERQFGCTICGQRFKQRYNVNAHMRTVKFHISYEACR